MLQQVGKDIDMMTITKPLDDQTLVERLRIRASIRRNNKERKSVTEGKPDRISDLLEEAANEIELLHKVIADLDAEIIRLDDELQWIAEHD